MINLPPPLFPAHAGVFPKRIVIDSGMEPLPRARGGISSYLSNARRNGVSSPRTRGYFLESVRRPRHYRLFPAHAGVFPCGKRSCGAARALPRARGGISGYMGHATVRAFSSPRTRGYFRASCRPTFCRALFPAHAGVFPSSSSSVVSRATLPRARGGISAESTSPHHPQRSSPRTRGYFRLHSR